MPIIQLTPQSKIEAYLYKELERIKLVIARNMAIIGEESVNTARNTGNYVDRTGNLRSSIGYVLVNNGKIINIGDFSRVGKGDEGVRVGKDFAKEIAEKYSKGIVLIIVAGMNYSGYVANRGYNVLDSARFKSEAMVEAFTRRLL